jgi:hypothetical protein
MFIDHPSQCFDHLNLLVDYGGSFVYKQKEFYHDEWLALTIQTHSIQNNVWM